MEGEAVLSRKGESNFCVFEGFVVKLLQLQVSPPHGLRREQTDW
jgi:hypothetical protein